MSIIDDNKLLPDQGTAMRYDAEFDRYVPVGDGTCREDRPDAGRSPQPNDNPAPMMTKPLDLAQRDYDALAKTARLPDNPAFRPQMPSIGRIVRYRLHKAAVEQINDRLQAARHNCLTQDRPDACVGNDVCEGQEVAAVIVAVWGNTPGSCVNLKLLLDGNFDHWVTSVGLGTEPGTWSWPERS
jgi:hypothetical protein